MNKTNTTTTKVKKAKVPKFVSGQFYQAPVNIGEKIVTVELPADVSKYLNIIDDKVYWAAVNGVIQLSGSEPNLVIPMIGVQKSEFVPQ